MQRPTTDIIRAQCQAIAAAAAPGDTIDEIAEKTEMHRDAVKRRVGAMERELGLEPAGPAERGGGRHPEDGTQRAHTRAFRRAGAVGRALAEALPVTPIAPYSETGAMSEGAHAPDLAHIPAELRHLAVPIGDIRLDPNNVNRHPGTQLEVLKSMLAEFGQRQLLVARRSTGILEAGEGRVVAAKAIGWSHMAMLYFDDDPVKACPWMIEMRGVPFVEQWEIFRTTAERLPKFGGAAIDGGGNGSWLGEQALTYFGEALITVVQLSPLWYAETMPRFRSAFEEHIIVVPADIDVRDDILMLHLNAKGIPTLGDLRRRDSKDRKPRHGDAVIGIALAHSRHRDAPMAVDFRPVDRWPDPREERRSRLRRHGL